MRALAVVILVAGFILGGWATAAAETSAPAERPGKVLADRLNLRGSPATTGEVVGSMVRDDTVTIIEEQGEWYRLRLEGGQTGWAARKFIQIVAETPTEASETATPEPSHDKAKKAVAPRTEKQGGGGGSFIGSVLKWGCLLGAGACGYLAYNEHTQGNDSYDEYKAKFAALAPPGSSVATQKSALNKAEYLRVAAEDHDKTSQTYMYAAGGLGAAFLVQQLFFGKHHDQAALENGRLANEPLLACGLRQGQLRAAVTFARF
jgi:hypothetical protein